MKVDGKNIKNEETGYALLYALGAITLVSLIMMGIFMHARNNALQIESLDQLTRMKDIKQYALQDASATLHNTIQEKLSVNTELGKGTSKNDDIANLKAVMEEVGTELKDKVKKDNIGKNKNFSYEITINKVPAVKEATETYKFLSDDTTGENGWVKAASGEILPDVTNTETIFELEVTAIQAEKNGQIKTSVAKADYIYEFQWEKSSLPDESLRLDSWRQVYYEPSLTAGDKNISADTWIRKMDRIYRYQKEPLEFPFSELNFNQTAPIVYGRSNNFLVDYQDQQLLDFLNAKQITKDLLFEGSLFLNHGSLLRGSKTLSVKNLLALRNDKNLTSEKNLVKDLSINVASGIYINIDTGTTSNDGGLYIDNTTDEIKTPNLLVNNTGSKTEEEGLFLAKGEIMLGKDVVGLNSSTAHFGQYSGDAKRADPQDNYWSQFMNGGFVIAGSKTFLTPVDRQRINNVSVKSDKNDKRKIHLKDGNFMMTSASLSNDGEADFAYADKGEYTSKPRPPSLLELEGENSSMIVENGISFIDAPKMRRRGKSSEKGTYYNNEKWWNTIRLKDKSLIDLGVAGVEPFNLEMEADTVMKMKLLPNLLLFDQTFIEKGFKQSNKKIKGKLVLETSTVNDVDSLKKKLEAIENVKVTVSKNGNNAKNGEITIVEPSVPINPKADWIGQRVFDYSELK